MKKGDINAHPLLEIKNLSINYNLNEERLEVVNNISLEVWNGEFVCVVGPNGCGKTTLVHAVAGFLPLTSGQVLLGGKEVLTPNPNCPLILQNLGLFYWMTVWDNVTFGLRAMNLETEEIDRIAKRWLDIVGLNGFEKRYPFELSGGMRQKLALARALVLGPKVLLMDEPFANLDMQTRESMQEEISRLADSTGMTVLMVTHNLDEAVFLADRIVLLTKRPARVKEIVHVSTAHPRSAEFRVSREFLEIKSRVWMSLKN